MNRYDRKCMPFFWKLFNHVWSYFMYPWGLLYVWMFNYLLDFFYFNSLIVGVFCGMLGRYLSISKLRSSSLRVNMWTRYSANSLTFSFVLFHFASRVEEFQTGRLIGFHIVLSYLLRLFTWSSNVFSRMSHILGFNRLPVWLYVLLSIGACVRCHLLLVFVFSAIKFFISVSSMLLRTSISLVVK